MMGMPGQLGVIDERNETEGARGKPLQHHTSKGTSFVSLPSPHVVSRSEMSPYIDFFHWGFSLTSPIKQSQALMVISLTQSCFVTINWHLLRPCMKKS